MQGRPAQAAVGESGAPEPVRVLAEAGPADGEGAEPRLALLGAIAAGLKALVVLEAPESETAAPTLRNPIGYQERSGRGRVRWRRAGLGRPRGWISCSASWASRSGSCS